MLRPASAPFQPDGGMRLVQGNLGRAIFKTSAVDEARWTIEAPARVLRSTRKQCWLRSRRASWTATWSVVVRFQGPRANGMPELHKLTPPLGVLQDRGFKVALITDGRMSGASGKVPAAIHVTPEALADGPDGGGPLARVQDGDMIRSMRARWHAVRSRPILPAAAPPPPPPAHEGAGRELFAMMRHAADGAERGASAMLALAGL